MRLHANGITLNVAERGTGDTALVFLHYWGGTARTWNRVIDALPDELRMIALDARGWGQSDRPADGYSLDAMADDAAAVIAATAPARFVLIGHSMGGKVAQVLAARRPAGLNGLVLVAPSPAGGKRLGPEERAAMGAAYDSAAAIEGTIDAVLAGPELDAEARAQVVADSLGGAPVAKAAWPDSMIGADVRTEPGAIDVPVLVIGGGHDRVDSPDLLRREVLPGLPGAEFAVIPNTGHLLPLEAPDVLADLILGFLGKAFGDAWRAGDLPARFDAALNRGDLEAVSALFHPRATMRLTDNTVVSGAGAIREAMRLLLADGPILHNHVRHVLRSDDSALLLIDLQIRVRPHGAPDIHDQGTATKVAERGTDGQWRLRISNPLGFAGVPEAG